MAASTLLARRLTSFSINFDEDEVTGICPISFSAGGESTKAFIREGLDGFYSLDGRKLVGRPTQKGVYINNGKMVVVK